MTSPIAGKKVVVSGAGGLLGRFLIDSLLREGKYCVVAMTSDVRMAENRFGKFEFFQAVTSDINSKEARDALGEASVFVNCAFPRTEDATGLAEGLEYVFSLIDVASSVGCGSVVNISSQSVYDPFRSRPATESASLKLDSKYAVAKFCTELYVGRMFRSGAFTNLRLASLISEEFGQRFVNKMVVKALRGEEISVSSPGERYGFLDVRDAAMAIVALLNSQIQRWEPVYNVGPAISYTIEEIAQMVADTASLYGKRCDVSLCDASSDKTKNSSLDSFLFYRDFKWSSSIEMGESIRRMFEALL